MTTTATSDRQARIPLAPRDKVAIIAGSGRLPVDLAEQLASRGQPFVVIPLEGEADPRSPLTSYEHEWIAIENIVGLKAILKRRGATHLVLAGGIARRPRLTALRPTVRLIAALPRIAAALARGDDAVLRLAIEAFEAHGFKVLGAHEIVPELLVSAGTMTATGPTSVDQADLAAAEAAARAIGALDIGQAAVSIGGRVVALEGIEGTDGLLERVRGLRSHGRLAGKQRGVLVKCVKPGQELRADLPSIGPATIDAAHAAGLAGIGIEAGMSLVLEAAETIARADRLGLFVVGIERKGR